MNDRVPVVILDKSYLYGASAAEIRFLCRQYRVLVTPGLMYELLKEREPARSNCFSKFPPGGNPVTLIDHLGGLLRYEIENLTPCTPIWDRRLRLDFEFNDRLAAGDYEGPEELWETMKIERQNIREMAAGFIECASFIPGWVPELQGYKAGSSPEMIERLQTEIATIPDTVRRLYKETYDERFPSADLIGPSWAHYRRLQLWIFAGLDFIHRYGAGDFTTVPSPILHTYVDIHYGVFGALADGLATRDKLLVKAFSLMRPDGILIQ